MENKAIYDSFPEESSLSKELMILRSQNEMAQALLPAEIEGNTEEETPFNSANLSYASSHPH